MLDVLESQLAAVAAPILQAEGGSWGAISVVLDIQRMSIVDTNKLVGLVTSAAQRLSARLT